MTVAFPMAHRPTHAHTIRCQLLNLTSKKRFGGFVMIGVGQWVQNHGTMQQIFSVHLKNRHESIESVNHTILCSSLLYPKFHFKIESDVRTLFFLELHIFVLFCLRFFFFHHKFYCIRNSLCHFQIRLVLLNTPRREREKEYEHTGRWNRKRNIEETRRNWSEVLKTK